MPHDPHRGKLLLSECVVEQDWLDAVARAVVEKVRNDLELSG
jgi:hypothetical protein